MNKTITSREQILAAAKKIAKEKGLSKISIRSVAAACQVSVGSIYNYFPNKTELIFSVVEDFWLHAIQPEHCIPKEKESFPDFFQRIYRMLFLPLQEFEESLLNQLTLLGSEEKEEAHKLEDRYFSHIKKGLQAGIDADAKISSKLWTEDFSRDSFISFVFQNMMSMLHSRTEDISFFLKVLEKLLY